MAQQSRSIESPQAIGRGIVQSDCNRNSATSTPYAIFGVLFAIAIIPNSNLTVEVVGTYTFDGRS